MFLSTVLGNSHAIKRLFIIQNTLIRNVNQQGIISVSVARYSVKK